MVGTGHGLITRLVDVQLAANVQTAGSVVSATMCIVHLVGALTLANICVNTVGVCVNQRVESCLACQRATYMCARYAESDVRDSCPSVIVF
jgi:hypothetical protein